MLVVIALLLALILLVAVSIYDRVAQLHAAVELLGGIEVARRSEPTGYPRPGDPIEP